MEDDWLEREREKPVEAHMVYCSKGPGNLINHISEHDGTRRSIQACHIIEKFNPQNAKDFAKIIYDNNIERDIVGWNLPMFWENEDLVNFCESESKKPRGFGPAGAPWSGDIKLAYPHSWEALKHDPKIHEKIKKDHEWYMQRCVTYADDVDLSADIWRLSPTIMQNYPSEKKMYMGTDIGEGWHSFKGKSLEEMSFLETRNKEIKP